MKLKYYLRGLGTGILITTLIMFFSYSYRDTMENKEEGTTKESASQESTTTDSGTEESTTEKQTTEKATTEKTTTQEPTTPEPTTPEPTTPEPTTPEPTTPEPTTEEPTTKPIVDNVGDTVELIIYRGNSSGVVASKLEELGVISDAKDFDRYLCENGLDGRIATGVYTVTIGASYEELAEIFTY